MNQQVRQAELYASYSYPQHRYGLELIETADPKPGERVLDLGCGPGTLTELIARRVGPEGSVVGVDPDVERVKLARKARSPECRNLSFEVGRAEDLALIPHGSIDLLFSNFALQFVRERARALREMARCLAPGGRCVFTACAHLSPLLGRVFNQDSEGPNPKNPGNIVLRADEWRAFLEQAGFLVDRA